MEAKGVIKTQEIADLIDELGIKINSRKRDIVYKRFIVMNFLRNHDFVYEEIGRLFGMDHSTIVHAIKKYKEYVNYTDFLYLESTIIGRLNNLVGYDYGEKKKELSELEFRILGITSLKDLNKIKREIVDKFN